MHDRGHLAPSLALCYFCVYSLLCTEIEHHYVFRGFTKLATQNPLIDPLHTLLEVIRQLKSEQKKQETK